MTEYTEEEVLETDLVERFVADGWKESMKKVCKSHQIGRKSHMNGFARELADCCSQPFVMS
jgi:hypothetical protein